MTWIITQLSLGNAATIFVEFGLNWVLQSSLLIGLGVARRTAASPTRSGRAVGGLPYDSGRSAHMSAGDHWSR